MTENESIKNINALNAVCWQKDFYDEEFAKSLAMAIQSLEEIQQYRAIGTIEEFKAFKLGRLGNKGFITIGQTIEEFKEEIRNKAIDEFVEVLKEKNKTFIIGNRMIEDIAERLKGGA